MRSKIIRYEKHFCTQLAWHYHHNKWLNNAGQLASCPHTTQLKSWHRDIKIDEIYLC